MKELKQKADTAAHGGGARRVFWRLARPLALLAFLLCATAARAQGSPSVVPPVAFNEGSGPCLDARVAATGPDRLAVGWTVPMGSESGVYVRWRVNYLIEPAARVATEATTAPRDLALAFDTAGRLHLVWTALDGPRRVLEYARLDAPGEAPALVRTLSGPTTPTAATTGSLALAPSADFPVMEANAEGGVLVAWQQTLGLRSSVRAVLIAGDGSVADLGSVSGASGSALNPQILTTDPPRVAWYEINEFASSARVDEWHADEARWRPSAWERQARLFDAFGQVQLAAAPDGKGLIGAWTQPGEDGGTVLVAGRPRRDPSPEVPQPPLELDVIDEPAGDPAAAQLSGAPLATLTWQLFGGKGQRVLIARPFSEATGGGAPVVLSPAGQRFAALPDSVSLGRWSAVAWIDDSRDGGSGDVYLAEVTWPAPRP